jgi:lipopolysaccharide biosynthesis regulator YciM
MSDPITVGLLIAVGLILIVVITLLFSSTPNRRVPPRGTAEALHRLVLGDRDQARKLLAEQIRNANAPPIAFLHLGDLLREDGEGERALALHQGLLARPALDPDVHRLTELAVTDDLMALGRVAEAEARLAALDVHLIDEALLARHAQSLHRLGREEDAADALERRARLLGKDGRRQAARYIAEIGRESLRRGRPQTARDRARRARHLDAELAATYVVEGDALAHLGQLPAALQVWRTGLDRSRPPRGALLPRMVEAAFQTGTLEACLTDLEARHEAHPDDRDLWKAVADLRLRRGDLESFLAEVRTPPYPGAADLSAWAGWLRHVSSHADARWLKELLAEMPDSFGPSRWRCPACHMEDPEPRVACMRCGRWNELTPVPAGRPRAATTPVVLEGA